MVRSEFYGRFLLQDWRTGNWLVLDEAASFAFVDEEFQKLDDPLLATLMYLSRKQSTRRCRTIVCRTMTIVKILEIVFGIGMFPM
jgi:hypothetical protein